MADRDHIDELELRVAIAASEERRRHEVNEDLVSLKDDIRREIRYAVIIGVTGGNAIAAFVLAKWGPHQAVQTTAKAVRLLLPL